jgi:putative ABC transport system permease protein
LCNIVAESETLLQDIRYSIRMLLKQPGFSFVIILVLALGIGINTTIFSLINTVLLHPLPFKDPDKIVMIWETDLKKGVNRSIVSPANYLDWKEQNRVFENTSAWRFWFFNLTGGDMPERLQGFQVSSSFFPLLGVEASLGRTFLPEDEQTGRDSVVVLSHGLWQRRFGADPEIIGRHVTIDGEKYTIVGVLPAQFRLFKVLNRELDLWVPLAIDPKQFSRDDHSINVYARLKPGITLEQAQSDINSIADRLEQEYPSTNTGRGAIIVPLREQLIQKARPILLMLFVAVLLVLTIACANVANLLLARSATRQGEMAIRMALGASRFRIARLLLTDGLLLALLGGGAGLIFSLWGIDLLNTFIPHRAISRINEFSADRQVIGFTVFVSLITGIIFGLFPALSLSDKKLMESLKQGGSNLSSSFRRMRILNSLVVVEIALAVMLLIGAALTIKSAVLLGRIDRGFDQKDLLTMQIWLSRAGYNKSRDIAEFYRKALDRIESIPGVESASAINFLPLSRLSDIVNFTIEGATAPPTPKEQPSARYYVIDAQYFKTMKVPLLRGRYFTINDDDETNGVIIINETMARRYWPDEDPVGKRIKPSFPVGKAPWRPESSNNSLTIVGIAADIKEDGLENSSLPQIYLPYLQNPSLLMNFVVRTGTDSMKFADQIQREIWAVDKDQPVYNIKLYEEIISDSFAESRIFTLLLSIFAVISLVLAAIGIYGVISYCVSERTHEIGIRIAIGAQTGDILKMIVREGFIITSIGTGIGIFSAFLLTRVLSSLLFGVSSTDLEIFTLIPVLLYIVALFACYIPARRATKVDPMVALRNE